MQSSWLTSRVTSEKFFNIFEAWFFGGLLTAGGVTKPTSLESCTATQDAAPST